MQRSEINAILQETKAVFAQNGIHLPPFAHFTPSDWAQQDLQRYQGLISRLGLRR